MTVITASGPNADDAGSGDCSVASNRAEKGEIVSGSPEGDSGGSWLFSMEMNAQVRGFFAILGRWVRDGLLVDLLSTSRFLLFRFFGHVAAAIVVDVGISCYVNRCMSWKTRCFCCST